jgi:alpha-ketoglutarate-dependent taurine dioxygenase
MEPLAEGAMVDGRAFPLVVRPEVEGVDLVAWARAARLEIEALLLRHGCVLFRGFAVAGVDDFGRFARVFAPELLDYRERAAPRREVAERVFTSTEYPREHVIPLHHEMSYARQWPSRLWLYCEEPPREGGRTPVADDRQVIRLLDEGVKRRFLERGVMYLRNFGAGVDLEWREAFQAERREDVEAYCREVGATFEWLPGDRLRTRLVRPATVAHPVTGDVVWFNHAHLFHSSSLVPEVRDSLRAQFAEEDLPRNALYGDGSPIEDAVLDAIRETYERAAVRFCWERGDILMVDNFLVSHGRESFVGPRRILVAMGDRYVARD